MKILLKAMETEEDLTRFMNFCEAHDIDAMARSNGTSVSLDMINFENGSIWSKIPRLCLATLSTLHLFGWNLILFRLS